MFGLTASDPRFDLVQRRDARQRLKDNLLTSAKLAVDETPVPVLDPGRGRTKTGYFWAMARDDRPWGGSDPPAVVYTYAPGRGGEHLEQLLANYRGIVQCDGYAPYKKLPQDRIKIAFCWSHLRRQFFDIAKGGDAPIAAEPLVKQCEFGRCVTHPDRRQSDRA